VELPNVLHDGLGVAAEFNAGYRGDMLVQMNGRDEHAVLKAVSVRLAVPYLLVEDVSSRFAATAEPEIRWTHMERESNLTASTMNNSAEAVGGGVGICGRALVLDDVAVTASFRTGAMALPQDGQGTGVWYGEAMAGILLLLR